MNCVRCSKYLKSRENYGTVEYPLCEDCSLDETVIDDVNEKIKDKKNERKSK